MKVRHYLAVALMTLIIQGVSVKSCVVQRCDAMKPVTCEP